MKIFGRQQGCHCARMHRCREGQESGSGLLQLAYGQDSDWRPEIEPGFSEETEMNTEAAQALDTIEHIGHFINGEMIAGKGRSQAVFNPATGEVAGEVALASKAT